MDNEIILVCLPPHTPHALHPLDTGLFKCVKSKWKIVLRENIAKLKEHCVNDSEEHSKKQI